MDFILQYIDLYIADTFNQNNYDNVMSIILSMTRDLSNDTKGHHERNYKIHCTIIVFCYRRKY